MTLAFHWPPITGSGIARNKKVLMFSIISRITCSEKYGGLHYIKFKEGVMKQKMNGAFHWPPITGSGIARNKKVLMFSKISRNTCSGKYGGLY